MISVFFMLLGEAYVTKLVNGESYTPAPWQSDDAVMGFAKQWQKEILFWAKEIIAEIIYKMRQMDQVINELAPDPRYQLGVILGRIFEIHRQQVDMYRRMKRRVDNKFNWVKLNQTMMMSANGSTFLDLKPQMYILALDYITRREAEIENLIKLSNWYMAEDEMAKYRPHLLPVAEDPRYAWQEYNGGSQPTPLYVDLRTRANDPAGSTPQTEDPMAEKEEALKAKMRSNYFKKRNNRLKK